MAVPHDVVMTQNVVDRVDIAVRDSPPSSALRCTLLRGWVFHPNRHWCA